MSTRASLIGLRFTVWSLLFALPGSLAAQAPDISLRLLHVHTTADVRPGVTRVRPGTHLQFVAALEVTNHSDHRVHVVTSFGRYELRSQGSSQFQTQVEPGASELKVVSHHHRAASREPAILLDLLIFAHQQDGTVDIGQWMSAVGARDQQDHEPLLRRAMTFEIVAAASESAPPDELVAEVRPIEPWHAEQVLMLLDWQPIRRELSLSGGQEQRLERINAQWHRQRLEIATELIEAEVGGLESRLHDIGQRVADQVEEILLPHQFERLVQIRNRTILARELHPAPLVELELLASERMMDELLLSAEVRHTVQSKAERWRQRHAELRGSIDQRRERLDRETSRLLLALLSPEQRRAIEQIKGPPSGFPNEQLEALAEQYQDWVFLRDNPANRSGSGTIPERSSPSGPIAIRSVELTGNLTPINRVWDYIERNRFDEALAITPSQRQQIDEINAEANVLHNEIHRQIREEGRTMDDLVELRHLYWDIKRRVEQVLLPHQLARIKQLEVQFRLAASGAHFHLLHPDWPAVLEMQAEQADHFRTTVEAYDTGRNELHADLVQQQQSLEEQAVEDVLNSLPDLERRAAALLLGLPFDSFVQPERQ